MGALDLEKLPDDVLIRQAKRVLEARVAKARVDPVAFLQFVMRDDRTGLPIRLAQMHKDWQKLLDDNNRVVLLSHTEAGKSSGVAVGRVLYELGRNTDLRVGVVSNTATQASKTIRALESYIEKSDELHAVFPKLQPGLPWSIYQLNVQRKSMARDWSVQAFGLHGNVLGSRIDLLVMDDILDFESTRNERARADTVDWYHATLEGRLTKGARVWMIGNAWHPDDLMHELTGKYGWPLFVFPLLREDGTVSWPEAWPPERIEDRRGRTPPSVWAREMMCRVRSDDESRFKREWIDLCLRGGIGMDCPWDLSALSEDEKPKGFRTVTGVDLGIGRKERNSRTSIFTGLVRPDGRKRVLSIDCGRWNIDEIIDRLVGHHQRYKSVAVVEDNAAQALLVQAARKHLPVVPFRTGRNKLDPVYGVESLAFEMSKGEWIIPSRESAEGTLLPATPQIGQWISDMMFYVPTEHTGDLLMSSWIFREGSRLGMRTPVRMVRGLDLVRR